MKTSTLTGIAMAGALAVTLGGCSSDPEAVESASVASSASPSATLPSDEQAFADIDKGVKTLTKTEWENVVQDLEGGDIDVALWRITGNDPDEYAPDNTSGILAYVEDHPMVQKKVALEQARIKKEKARKAAARAERLRHKEVDSRQISLIIKDPDARQGDRIIVYGQINQFDSATGSDRFLADVASYNTTSYGYFEGENSMFVGTDKMLKNFVEDDVFRAKVEVVGSFSYDTQAGGNTTVPVFKIQSIERIGNNG